MTRRGPREASSARRAIERDADVCRRRDTCDRCDAGAGGRSLIASRGAVPRCSIEAELVHGAGDLGERGCEQVLESVASRGGSGKARAPSAATVDGASVGHSPDCRDATDRWSAATTHAITAPAAGPTSAGYGGRAWWWWMINGSGPGRPHLLAARYPSSMWLKPHTRCSAASSSSGVVHAVSSTARSSSGASRYKTKRPMS